MRGLAPSAPSAPHPLPLSSAQLGSASKCKFVDIRTEFGILNCRELLASRIQAIPCSVLVGTLCAKNAVQDRYWRCQYLAIEAKRTSIVYLAMRYLPYYTDCKVSVGFFHRQRLLPEHTPQQIYQIWLPSTFPMCSALQSSPRSMASPTPSVLIFLSRCPSPDRFWSSCRPPVSAVAMSIRATAIRPRPRWRIARL